MIRGASLMRLSRTIRPRIWVVPVRFNHSKERDPLGLISILQDLRKEEQEHSVKTPLESPNVSDMLKTLDESEPDSSTDSQIDSSNDLKSFLDSLELNDDSPSSSFEDQFDEPGQSQSEIIAQERELFRDIFKSFNTDSPAVDLKSRIYDNIINLQTVKKSSYSKHSDHLTRVREAISPTIAHIEAIDTKKSLVSSLNDILEQTSSLLKSPDSEQPPDQVFLPNVESDAMDNIITEIHESSLKKPQMPVLNILTLPIIFNQFLKTNNHKFKDGQLSITLFNILKNDLNLYLVICNQDTYNEILKTIWIFQGKLSLYQVEALVTEMLNNGFQGNLVTFNILKQIIVDYYGLKMNNYKPIRNSLPVWNKDDDQRVQRLESALRTMALRIRREYRT
ncbi:hypothetical protein PSN45_000526 [Yamadazyma tenuis]|nr:hypothetical protein PSN45_000526 [Yamadazyma tenuis]